MYLFMFGPILQSLECRPAGLVEICARQRTDLCAALNIRVCVVYRARLSCPRSQFHKSATAAAKSANFQAIYNPAYTYTRPDDIKPVCHRTKYPKI